MDETLSMDDQLAQLHGMASQRGLASVLQNSTNPYADLGLQLASGGQANLPGGLDPAYEALRQQKLQALSQPAADHSTGDRWAKIAAGLTDALSQASNARMGAINTATGINSPIQQSTNVTGQIARALASRDSAVKQKALEDQKMLGSIEAIKAKNLAAQEAAKKDADLAKYRESMLGIAQQKLDKPADTTRMDFTRETQMEKQANQIHSRVVAKLQSDPLLKQKLTQLNNLSAAMNNFQNADHPTPQSFDELQQAVRANLGIKGTSSIGEREHTTMNSLGLNGARMMQFLTGNPQDIAKDTGLAKHIKDLVKLEQKNIQNQTQKHLNTLSAGHGSMYKKYPELKADLEDVTSAYGGEFASPVGLPAASGPKVGDIEQGHRFKGGDAADPASWEAL